MLMRREWLMVVVVKEECGRTMGMEAVGGVCCGVMAGVREEEKMLVVDMTEVSRAEVHGEHGFFCAPKKRKEEEVPGAGWWCSTRRSGNECKSARDRHKNSLPQSVEHVGGRS